MKREQLAATYAEWIAERLTYEALFDHAMSDIRRDVLAALDTGSITEDELFDIMETE